MNRPSKILWGISLLSGIAAVGILVSFGYFAQLSVPSTGSGENVQNSALLPADWKTYRADVWTVGYPSDFAVDVRPTDGAVSFRPSEAPEKKTYFLVRQEPLSLDAYKIARDTEGYLAPIDVTISNYPAAKYVIGDDRTEYVVAYRDGVIIVTSDDIDDETIAIMFATFAVKTE